MSSGQSAAPHRFDVHHHVLPPQYVNSTPMPVRVPDADTQLRTMDDFAIRAAITSLTPRVFEEHRHERAAVARACNEFQAGLVQAHPARFGAFAVLPLPEVDNALKEVAYALDELHLDGVGLFSSFEGHFLGDAIYDPVFEELNRRGAVVFVHPSHCKAPDELHLGAPASVIEYLFDSTRAIVNMLHTGAIRRYPNVRIIFSHGGSTVPYIAGRIAGMEHSVGLPDVLGTLRSVYYDVASAMTPYSLPSLLALADPTHVLWGSDLPFIYGERLREEVDGWDAYAGLDAAQRAAIERGNALRLFPRFAEAGAR